MKSILVPYLILSSLIPEMTEVSKAWDKLGEGNTIDCVNWPGYDYQPKVRFNIGYGEKEIYIKYYVHEQYVMAQKQHKIPFKVKKRVCLLDLRFSEGFLAFFLLAASC